MTLELIKKVNLLILILLFTAGQELSCKMNEVNSKISKEDLYYFNKQQKIKYNYKKSYK